MVSGSVKIRTSCAYDMMPMLSMAVIAIAVLALSFSNENLEDGGSVQDLDFLTDEEKDVYKTFKEINQLELVKQAGIRQQFIDQSVSLNLAFPKEATPKWINKVHMEAWKKGIKTLYYMRTESVLRGDIADQAMDESCLSCDG